jgi:hypothetical protein
MKTLRLPIRLLGILSLALSLLVTGRAAGAVPGIQPSKPEIPALPSSSASLLAVPPASSLGVQFVHIATADNTTGNGTVLDHPLTNGNPDAIIIVTPNYNPGNFGGTYLDHPIGVFYDGSKWRIFTEDLTAMPVGAAFNVIIPTAGSNVFVHKATALNMPLIGSTQIDNALTNGNPNAMILVTQNWNPGGGLGTYNNHSVGVWYDGSKWTVFNQDIAAIPVNAAFNVFVLPTGAGVFVQTSTAGNQAGNYTKLDHPLTNGQPNAIVFATPNRNPGGVGGAGYDHNIGVWYSILSGRWAVFSQDNLTVMPLNVSFNILVLEPFSDVFVHKATAGNRTGNNTYLDRALTNGHPNAVVFTTSNWNPGGSGATYNDHNTGVYFYNADSQWRIFNQDLASMPLNAAFNVLVPHPDTSVFIHKATVENTSGHITTIDYPLLNDNPGAIIFVEQNWNPGGVGGTYNDHPLGVYYILGKWRIFNEDAAAIPVGASFNVYVATPGQGVFVHSATAANSSNNRTILDNPLANNNPDAIVLVTQNWTPSGVYNAHPIGVYYSGNRWRIFNQDLSTMPANAAFNVYVYGNYKISLPFIRR